MNLIMCQEVCLPIATVFFLYIQTIKDDNLFRFLFSQLEVIVFMKDILTPITEIFKMNIRHCYFIT